MSASWQKRLMRDVKELQESGFEVHPDKPEEELQMECFQVTLKGPEDTPYSSGTWRIRFTVPPQYPFSSPSVGFVQHIMHPNVDWASGSICLDALNAKWSPVFTLKHIVDSLLPYLLRYPNPDDPLNREAAVLMRQNPAAYTAKVLDLTARFAV